MIEENPQAAAHGACRPPAPEGEMKIALEHIRLFGRHGVLPQERAVGAEYELDITLVLPPTYGCLTDNIDDTISYADLYDTVKAEFDRPSKLLEHLARRIVDAVYARWPGQIRSQTLRITKIAPPIPACQGQATVTLTRFAP